MFKRFTSPDRHAEDAAAGVQQPDVAGSAAETATARQIVARLDAMPPTDARYLACLCDNPNGGGILEYLTSMANECPSKSLGGSLRICVARPRGVNTADDVFKKARHNFPRFFALNQPEGNAGLRE